MKQIIACGALALAFAAQASDIGMVKTVTGASHLERAGQRVAVAPGVAVRENDTLVTGADGAVGLTFSDNSLLSVGPNSSLVIDHYAFDSTTHAGRFDASLRRGTLAVVSGRIVKQSPEAMRVRTPAAIMGVRGTEFVVRVTPQAD